MIDSTLPINSYMVGEKVKYFCTTCDDWVSCKVVSVQEYPEKILISHFNARIGLYKEDLYRLRKTVL